MEGQHSAVLFPRNYNFSNENIRERFASVSNTNILFVLSVFTAFQRFVLHLNNLFLLVIFMLGHLSLAEISGQWKSHQFEPLKMFSFWENSKNGCRGGGRSPIPTSLFQFVIQNVNINILVKTKNAPKNALNPNIFCDMGVEVSIGQKIQEWVLKKLYF